MLTSLTANASSVTASSGGGESAKIYAHIFDNKLVTTFSYGSLPCKSLSRTVYYRLAIHHLSSDTTNSVVVFQAPLTRTHCPPPPYCLSSPARSIYHTQQLHRHGQRLALTALIGYWQREGSCSFSNPECTGEELLRAESELCN